jgi:hypothetical protein
MGLAKGPLAAIPNLELCRNAEKRREQCADFVSYHIRYSIVSITSSGFPNTGIGCCRARQVEACKMVSKPFVGPQPVK